VRYTAITGFFFLRFVCPALLNPVLFGLVSEQPSSSVQRDLMLIAKTIQSLASLCAFGAKETFMQVMNGFILDNVEHMKHFVDELCTVPTTLPNEGPVAIPVNFGRAMAKIHHITNTVLQELRKNSDAISNQSLDPTFDELQRVVEALNLEVANSLYGLLRSIQEMPCRRNVSPSPDKQASTTASDATNSASDSLHQELLTCLEQLEALVTQRNTSGATVQLSARQSDPSPVQHNTEANNLVPTGPTVSSADTNVSYNTRTTPPTATATTTTAAAANNNNNNNNNTISTATNVATNITDASSINNMSNDKDKNDDNEKGHPSLSASESPLSSSLPAHILRRMSRHLSQIEQARESDAIDPDLEAKQLVLHLQYLS
jgi:Tfp pilus assembly major pilin PilA